MKSYYEKQKNHINIYGHVTDTVHIFTLLLFCIYILYRHFTSPFLIHHRRLKNTSFLLYLIFLFLSTFHHTYLLDGVLVSRFYLEGCFFPKEMGLDWFYWTGDSFFRFATTFLTTQPPRKTALPLWESLYHFIRHGRWRWMDFRHIHFRQILLQNFFFFRLYKELYCCFSLPNLYTVKDICLTSAALFIYFDIQ